MNNLSTCILLVCCYAVQAQHDLDTTFIVAARQNTIDLYNKAVKGQTALYNGSEYKRIYGSNDEHAFYKSDDWIVGEVIYEKLQYSNVPLLYDITQDQAITENFYNGNEMVLISEKLDRFTMAEDVFIKIDHQSLPKTGFYQLLYDGPTRVVAKRLKFKREEIEELSVRLHFDQKDRYYIYKNGTYFKVNNKASVLNLLADKKTTLKAFARHQKLDFRTDFDSALKLIASQYDQPN